MRIYVYIYIYICIYVYMYSTHFWVVITIIINITSMVSIRIMITISFRVTMKFATIYSCSIMFAFYCYYQYCSHVYSAAGRSSPDLAANLSPRTGGALPI